MKASIIIPLKHEPEQILECLEAIAKEDLSFIDQVIVVENGSHDLRTLPSYPFKTKLLHLTQGNRSKARNTGANLAQAEILIFLDADVVIEKNWIKKVIESFTPHTIAVQAPIIPECPSSTLLTKIVIIRSFTRNSGSFLSIKKENTKNVILDSAAFAIRREIFEKIGGFDESLMRQEDRDLTQRLLSIKGIIFGLKTSSVRKIYTKGLWNFYLRELSMGYHIVRFHEKYASPPFQSFRSLSGVMLEGLLLTPGVFNFGSLKRHMRLLDLTYRLGNLFGFLRSIVAPQSKKILTNLQRAQIEHE